MCTCSYLTANLNVLFAIKKKKKLSLIVDLLDVMKLIHKKRLSFFLTFSDYNILYRISRNLIGLDVLCCVGDSLLMSHSK